MQNTSFMLYIVKCQYFVNISEMNKYTIKIPLTYLVLLT